jgi:hypothetical protein
VTLLVAALGSLPVGHALGASFSTPALLVGESASEPCGDQTVDVDYDVAYNVDLGGFGISDVQLSGLGDHCEGYTVSVALEGLGGVPLAEMTTEVAAAQVSVAVPAGTPVSAEQLTGVSVVLKRGEA